MYAFVSDWERAPRTTPPATTLLAVGDVHGCAAHLSAMRGQLRPVAARAAELGRRCELVMIGDYTDRGPDSLGVLGQLGTLEDDLKIPVHLLRGNHDQLLIDAMRVMPHAGVLESWCYNGGVTTLFECGLDADEIFDGDPAEVSARLRERLGPALIALLKSLPLHWRCGDYLFVHAGVDPARPFEAQGSEELLWLREPFLSGQGWRHPFAVVHGHTVLGPEVLPHRIGTDSGCFRTGVLTAVELADDRLRFHMVSSEVDLRAFREVVGYGQDRVWRAMPGC